MKLTQRHFLPILVIWLLGIGANPTPVPPISAEAEFEFTPLDLAAADSPEAEAWIEAQLAAMSLEQRIGQLFVVRAHSDGSYKSLAETEAMVSELYLGGVCFFKGTPEDQVRWTNVLQAASAKTPLLVSMDAEWGASMRFGEKQIRRLPYALTIGASNDLGLSREIGRETGRELRRLGVHMSYAPVADLNSNPANPVIGQRSFGELPLRVGSISTAYARGLADAGILAVAKHYPGHGDTNVDSHVDLPVLNKSALTLDTLDMVPFRILAQDRVAGIMTGHLAVPQLDARLNRPASLSALIVEDIIRKRWNYNGLIISDGLDMAGVTKHFPPGELAVEAFLAGNDILLIPTDIPAGIEAIKKAALKGRILTTAIDQSVRRILKAKYTAGLHSYQPLSELSVTAEINREIIDALSEKLFRSATTIVRNKTVKLPIVKVDSLRTAVVALGSTRLTEFQRSVARYTPVSQLNLGKVPTNTEIAEWAKKLSAYELVLISLHQLNWNAKQDFGLSKEYVQLIQAIKPSTRVVVVVLGSPYVLSKLENVDNLLLAYEDHDLAQKAAAEVIYGAVGASGSLPVSAGKSFKVGMGVKTAPLFRLLYSQPSNAGFRESALQQADALAREAINARATPGGVMLVARYGQVGQLKAYGNYTYEASSASVDVNTIYDLASVTKVAATTLALMRLHERGIISVYDPIGLHLPMLANTNKAGLSIQDILAHQARLQPWIPFFEATVVNDHGTKSYVPGVYASSAQTGYSVPVTEKLFILDSYRDSIYQQIAASELLGGRGYKYSDLGFFLMAQLVQEKTGLPLDEYVAREFYRPLGLRTMGYKPLERIGAQFIAPTEDDSYWRFGRVQGYVHDMGAAMLGGVSGHAGLFSNVADLAVIGQMMLNGGFYGGQRYFKEETIQLFTTRHHASTRRALGWDMAELSSRGSSNMSALASAKTFGHLGFTGTCMWADPETGVLFVWLTNRTFPRMTLNKFNSDRYRPRMQSAVYEGIF